MKKLLTFLLAAVMTFGMSLGFTSCNETSSDNTLVVYTEAGFAPWEFTEKGSTEIIGVDVEIAKYIANKYNYKLTIVDGSFDAIVAGIEEDNALGIAGISWTSDRAKVLEFSDFYYGGAVQTVVYLKTSQPAMTETGEFAKSNFEGKKIVYQTGSTSNLLANEKKTEWKVSDGADYDTVLAALEEVKGGNGGIYLVVDSQVAAQLVAKNNDVECATIEGVDAESYGVVAKKGNTELIGKVNEALKELLVKDAEGKSQIDKWLAQFEAISPED